MADELNNNSIKNESRNNDIQNNDEMKYLKGSTRNLLNDEIIMALKQGLELMEDERPKNRLKFLGEYFIKKSEEMD